MPKLVHVSHAGVHKARMAALSAGGSTVAATLVEARSLRTAAVRLGLRVSVYRISRGCPQHLVTVYGYRRPLAAISG